MKPGAVGIDQCPTTSPVLRRAPVVPLGIGLDFDADAPLQLGLGERELLVVQTADHIDVMVFRIGCRFDGGPKSKRPLNIDVRVAVAHRRVRSVQPFTERLVAALRLFIAVWRHLQFLNKVFEQVVDGPSVP